MEKPGGSVGTCVISVQLDWDEVAGWGFEGSDLCLMFGGSDVQLWGHIRGLAMLQMLKSLFGNLDLVRRHLDFGSMNCRSHLFGDPEMEMITVSILVTALRLMKNQHLNNKLLATFLFIILTHI